MTSNNVARSPWDPREQAYLAGKELARKLEMASFEHPFFEQGQMKRMQQIRRQVHVISDTEYTITEEITYIEITSFGNDIFGK